ncbi:RcpC/CpaB family pilus assembly protein [Streptomyces sp. NBC_00059]|uniref:RcpC/CpaB family pilus assembly protein n=1 Tax=Streptomyces sp. NBC_00059 TaxID=2975635 RepID=UPI0022571C18|nr:RcpC/CpaB family pilus assembly protein [Streptomyces sp. NBC_00059]MCX5411955.1 RcpC/CpaB family pilus assembly protein [Streptomyces sp. NBC_00059]
MFPSVPATRPAPPAPCGVPPFAPLRVRGGGGRRFRRVLRGRRRALAAGFALASAALAASGMGGGKGAAAVAGDAPPGPEQRRAVRLVSAPVRIADAATVGLLRPGDRVDVIAAVDGGSGARVVARDVRVAQVPRGAGGTSFPETDIGSGMGDGALVVLSVERHTATALAGAGVSGRLAVAVSHAE